MVCVLFMAQERMTGRCGAANAQKHERCTPPSFCAGALALPGRRNEANASAESSVTWSPSEAEQVRERAVAGM